MSIRQHVNITVLEFGASKTECNCQVIRTISSMWGQGYICFLARAKPDKEKMGKKRNRTLSFWIFTAKGGILKY